VKSRSEAFSLFPFAEKPPERRRRFFFFSLLTTYDSVKGDGDPPFSFFFFSRPLIGIEGEEKQEDFFALFFPPLSPSLPGP